MDVFNVPQFFLESISHQSVISKHSSHGVFAEPRCPDMLLSKCPGKGGGDLSSIGLDLNNGHVINGYPRSGFCILKVPINGAPFPEVFVHEGNM